MNEMMKERAVGGEGKRGRGGEWNEKNEGRCGKLGAGVIVVRGGVGIKQEFTRVIVSLRGERTVWVIDETRDRCVSFAR